MPPPRPCRRPGWWLRTLRGLSGVLTGGLVALAMMIVLAQWLITASDRPGPGMAVVVGHAAGALMAVVAQVVTDRSVGPRATLGAAVVVSCTAAVLWFGWYA